MNVWVLLSLFYVSTVCANHPSQVGIVSTTAAEQSTHSARSTSSVETSTSEVRADSMEEPYFVNVDRPLSEMPDMASANNGLPEGFMGEPVVMEEKVLTIRGTGLRKGLYLTKNRGNSVVQFIAFKKQRWRVVIMPSQDGMQVIKLVHARHFIGRQKDRGALCAVQLPAYNRYGRRDGKRYRTAASSTCTPQLLHPYKHGDKYSFRVVGTDAWLDVTNSGSGAFEKNNPETFYVDYKST